MTEEFTCPQCKHTYLMIYRDKKFNNDLCMFCARDKLYDVIACFSLGGSSQICVVAEKGT